LPSPLLGACTARDGLVRKKRSGFSGLDAIQINSHVCFPTSPFRFAYRSQQFWYKRRRSPCPTRPVRSRVLRPQPAEVRSYWTRQWAAVDPHVEPVGFSDRPDNEVVFQVHQIVCDLDGKLLAAWSRSI
jgi:hypothetical protein